MIVYTVEYPIRASLEGNHRVWTVDARPKYEESVVRFIEWPKAPRDPARITWMAPDGAREL
jgi:hypothetical protein